MTPDGQDGPPRRPSGTFRIAKEHARRATEILRACNHAERVTQRRCILAVGHDGLHKDKLDHAGWRDEDGAWT